MKRKLVVTPLYYGWTKEGNQQGMDNCADVDSGCFSLVDLQIIYLLFFSDSQIPGSCTAF